MAEPLVVENIRVNKGQRVMEVVQVPLDGSTIDVPVIVINGENDGPRVSITGGIHGGEYVGMETARRLGTEIDPTTLSGSLVIVPIVNTAALKARAVYVSALDEHNINRVFPGQPKGDPSERLAHWLFENVIRPSDFHIDLHGGDLIEALEPFVLYLRSDDAEIESASRRMAIATGIPYIIRTEVGGAAYAEAAAAGIPSIIAEVGSHGLWPREDVNRFYGGVQDVLRHLGVLTGSKQVDDSTRIYEELIFLRAPMHGLFYPRVTLRDTVKAGELLGTITDYFGNERHRVEAPKDSEVVVVVTTLVTNEGDLMIGLIA
jgi:predicted deacylase